MADLPFSLLLRLGGILLPVLAGILIWSYYGRPTLSQSARPNIIAISPANAPPQSVPLSSEAAAIPPPTAATAPAPSVPTPVSMTSGFAEPSPVEAAAMGNSDAVATTRAAQPGPKGASGATPPAVPSARQAPAAAQQAKVPETRKQQAATAAQKKRDKEIDAKLSICSGC